MSDLATWGHKQAGESQVGAGSLDSRHCTELAIPAHSLRSLAARPRRRVMNFSLAAHASMSQLHRLPERKGCVFCPVYLCWGSHPNSLKTRFCLQAAWVHILTLSLGSSVPLTKWPLGASLGALQKKKNTNLSYTSALRVKRIQCVLSSENLTPFPVEWRFLALLRFQRSFEYKAKPKIDLRAP